MKIRRVEKSEANTLFQLIRETFLESFGQFNTEKDMQHYISSNLSDNRLNAEFDNEESYFYFLLEGEKEIGYLKLNIGLAQTEPKYPNGLEIERIYISSAFQDNGLGSTMMDFSISQAKELKKSPIWLGVWEHNQGAIRFYQRYGFDLAGSHEFMLGTDLQTDIIMKKDLISM